jgi:hypothetical protein
MKMLNKIIGGSSIAIAAVLAFSASTTQAQNLLANPGFDLSGAGNFTPNPIYFDTTPTHVGTANSSTNHFTGVGMGWANWGSGQSDMASSPDSPLSPSYAMLVAQGAGNAWSANGGYQVVTITPGQEYTYSMYVLTDTGIKSSYGTPVDLQLVFLNSSGTTNGLSSPWSGGGFNAAYTPAAIDTWQQFNITVTAPLNAVYAETYFMEMNGTGTTNVQNTYFDNASLTATPEPASLALVGMGLASLYLIRRRKS